MKYIIVRLNNVSTFEQPERPLCKSDNIKMAI